MLFLFSITWGAVSGWWTPVCLLLGLLYAWLMYREPVELSKSMRYGLATLRAFAVFFIAFLPISPLVQSVTYQPQKPLVLIAQDNSSSIQTFKPAGFNAIQLVKTLASLKQQLGNDYEVREYHFNSNLSNGLTDSFTGKQTNIASVIKQLNEQFVNQNIGALVLATDGLYNQGADPQYEARNLKTSIYTIALGDPIPRRDLLIGNVNYNKTAFLGNDFVIEVLAEAYQSQGETLQISVAEDGRNVAFQNVAVNSNAYRKVIPVKVNADKKGIHRFTISIKPVKNELSVQNNTETIYIEVLDARQKVLLAYQSPHPDISVIKQTIERNKNYEVKAVQAANLNNIKLSDYGLVLLYQLPVTANTLLNDYLTKSKTPVWYIAGAQTNLAGFNTEQKAVQIASTRPDMQEVFALPVNNFSAFTLSDSTQNKIAHLPPLLAPFGNYGTSNTAATLFRQRIGNVSTDYPLLTFNEAEGRRTAVLTGEGLWRWQLAEYQTFGNHSALEELFSQSIQYLTANANRQRFRAYPARNVFDEGENVLLNAELYNDALELINTPDVNINLKNTTGKNYSFLFSREGKSYQLNANAIPVGEYSYTATTKIGKQPFTAHGQFSVRALNLENRQSTANHQLLNSLARQSGGQMLLPSQVNRLADLIRHNENIKTVVYDDKHYSDLIDVKWVFVLIVALLSTEWFLRKRASEI
ncbi:VWA domain-containing protein [Mucilaginibacter robiniae]|uniref:VWA domain-containing protein n=1 Tax=Mucilaginibacter robiniae TaxID=2728022 RepID=A0A7L5E1N9_9SPHI|nr:VWA domain-containing protein [Mucilaginibacter robiniae]QJD94743.1 VWA domain-containing protein [Mucilaginibacter robiniae]